MITVIWNPLFEQYARINAKDTAAILKEDKKKYPMSSAGFLIWKSNTLGAFFGTNPEAFDDFKMLKDEEAFEEFVKTLPVVGTAKK